MSRKDRVRRINRIVTHTDPHVDEMLAHFMIKQAGGDRLRLASDAKIEFVGMTMSHEHAVMACQAHLNDPKNGGQELLFLGVGFGEFDDHGPGGSHKSCCGMMSEYLGIQNDKSFYCLTKAVTDQDKGRGKSKGLTLPQVVKLAHRYGVEFKKTMRWAEFAFRAIIRFEPLRFEQVRQEGTYLPVNRAERNKQRFEEDCPWMGLEIEKIAELIHDPEKRERWLEFAFSLKERQQANFDRALKYATKHCEIHKTSIGNRRFLFLEAKRFEADEDTSFMLEIDPASRASGGVADFLLVQNPDGTLLVAANKTAQTDLGNFISALRQAEAEARGIDPAGIDLSAEGTLEELPSWHVHEGIGKTRVYNGSRTRPYVEPTVLEFDTIRAILLESLGVRPARKISTSTTTAA